MANLYATLSNGGKIPLIGLGTWQKSAARDVELAVKAAIDTGYRHIDCAYLYQNEKEIGDALKEIFQAEKVKREDLYITSKLWGTFHRPDKVEHAIRLCLKNLQLDYLDLYLIHSPMAAYYKSDSELLPTKEDGKPYFEDVKLADTWRAMETLVQKGLTKSIGVSNFTVSQLNEILPTAKVPCVMNQIENHPFLDQKELINFCKSKNIGVTAYCPLVSPCSPWVTDKDPKHLQDPVVMILADSKGCTAAQVLIAYNVSQCIVCVPKSVNSSRIKENFKSYDVELRDEEIQKLDALASGFKACTFDFWKDHANYPFQK
ncbi:Alcohol dehydrogenase [NADP(+)] A [Holothuria leucospilota]|uniref:Alcohol dehydrogenase [NADP(+)] A n=1 Tax=Holothuria leucospilota TaxID=206669 RepID=A0A9Q1H3E8_HOLLE|nr:Alcohol dehydrogenase [NADP(+)] A [Holothuria leucospilota]